MPKLKFLNSLLLIITTVLIATKAQANCSQTTAKLALVQPAMERYFQQLQQKTQFPWGKVQPYGKLSGDRITLTPEFERLTGTQKKQAIDLLDLGRSPYFVFASDYRVISYPYDGCTRLTLLTELNRYQIEVGYSRSLPDRQIRFPLSPT